MNKLLKISKILLKVLLIPMLIISILAFGLVTFNMFSFSAEVSKYIYLLLGVFVLPIEFLINKGVGVMLAQEKILFLVLISILLIIISILFLLSIKKMYKNGIKSTNRFTIFTLVLSLIFSIYFIFASIVFIANFASLNQSLNLTNSKILTTISNILGVNITLLKELIIAGILSIVNLFALVVLCIFVSKNAVVIKNKRYYNIQFYSKDYELVEEPVKKSSEKQKTVQEPTEVTTGTKESKSLINKIMALEELKRAGKISNVEYTRLRQSAIKRYKK